MQTASYYRNKARRVRLLAEAMTDDDDRRSLRELAQDLEDIAVDLETNAIKIEEPSAMPQLSRDRSR